MKTSGSQGQINRMNLCLSDEIMKKPLNIMNYILACWKADIVTFSRSSGLYINIMSRFWNIPSELHKLKWLICPCDQKILTLSIYFAKEILTYVWDYFSLWISHFVLLFRNKNVHGMYNYDYHWTINLESVRNSDKMGN